MPVIPVQPQLLSTDVPGADKEPSRLIGQTGAALEGAGNQIGGQAFNLIDKVKHAQAVSASSTALAQGMLDAQDEYASIKSNSKDGFAYDDDGKPLTNPDGSQRSITDEFRDRVNERFQKDQLEMPSALAQQMYQERAGEFYNGQVRNMNNDEDILTAHAARESEDNNKISLLNRQYSSPSVDGAYRTYQMLASQILDNDPSPAGQERVRKMGEELADSTLKGAANQILSDKRSGAGAINRTQEVAYWRSVVNGTDAETFRTKKNGLIPLSEMFNPNQKAARDEELIKLDGAARQMDMAAFNDQHKNSIAAITMGKPGSDQIVARSLGQINSMIAKGMPTAVASQKRAEIMGAQALGSIYTPAFAAMNPAEQSQMIESQAKRITSAAQYPGGTKEDGAYAEQSFRDQAATVIQQINSAKQRDFPAFVESVDSSIRTDMSTLKFDVPQSLQDKGPQIQASIQKTQMYAEHSSPGMQAPVITKDRAAQVAKALTDPNLNQQQTADSVRALSQAYGPYYPALMHQLVTQQHLDKKWEMAAFFPGPSTEDAVSAIKGGAADSKNFETLAAQKEVTPKQFNQAVADKLSPWITTFVNQNPGDPQNAQRAAAIQSVVTDRAKQIYTQGNGNTSRDEAAALAVNSMLGKNASIEESKPGWFGSGRTFTYMIPNSDGSRSIGEPEKAQIRQFVTLKNTGDGLKSLGVVGPPNSAPTFHDDIAKTGRFSLSPNMQGYNYFYVDPRAQREVPARVPNGSGGVKPLFVPLSQMMAPTPIPGKAAPKTFGQGE